jgi:hypothetical protein
MPIVIARNVKDSLPGAVVICGRTPGKFGMKSLNPVKRHVIHDVMAQHTARIRQALWIIAVSRIEQDADRLPHGRRQNHGFGASLILLLILRIDIGYTPRLSGLAVDQYRVHHGIGAQGEIA